jgi:hypothetical protein
MTVTGFMWFSLNLCGCGAFLSESPAAYIQSSPIGSGGIIAIRSIRVSMMTVTGFMGLPPKCVTPPEGGVQK